MDKRVEAILECLNSNWNRPLKVSSLARSVNLSTVRLQHLVKKETGKNIRQHIMQKRLECAAALLENTEFSVKEICHTTGYSDVRNFYRSFRREFGVGPAAFRTARWQEVGRINRIDEHEDRFDE